MKYDLTFNAFLFPIWEALFAKFTAPYLRSMYLYIVGSFKHCKHSLTKNKKKENKEKMKIIARWYDFLVSILFWRLQNRSVLFSVRCFSLFAILSIWATYWWNIRSFYERYRILLLWTFWRRPHFFHVKLCWCVECINGLLTFFLSNGPVKYS